MPCVGRVDACPTIAPLPLATASPVNTHPHTSTNTTPAVSVCGSLQARYLADHPLNVSTPFALVCLIAGGIGFAIFRAANAQKDTFKKNPNDASVAGA